MYTILSVVHPYYSLPLLPVNMQNYINYLYCDNCSSQDTNYIKYKAKHHKFPYVYKLKIEN